MQRISIGRPGLTGIVALVLAACGGPGESPEPPAAESVGTTEQAGVPACEDPSERKAEIEAQKEAFDEALEAAQASSGAGEPALWTLSDEDTTLYLLGTVHLLRPDLQWRSEEIDRALKEADTVVFETDISSQKSQAEMMRFISTRGMFTDGRQLTSLLCEAEREELQKALDTVGYPLGAFQPMRPWWAAVNLSVIQIQKEGFDPESGVEKVLEAEAVADGKSFAYLETIDEQLGRLANMPDEEQVDFLIGSAESIEEGAAVLDVLVSEWADGDVTGLGLLMSNPDMMGSDEVYEALLLERNRDWVSKIETMLDEPGTRLIAVGAGHLAGEDSVIRLLEQEGYEIEGP